MAKRIDVINECDFCEAIYPEDRSQWDEGQEVPVAISEKDIRLMILCTPHRQDYDKYVEIAKRLDLKPGQLTPAGMHIVRDDYGEESLVPRMGSKISNNPYQEAFCPICGQRPFEGKYGAISRGVGGHIRGKHRDPDEFTSWKTTGKFINPNEEWNAFLRRSDEAS